MPRPRPRKTISHGTKSRRAAARRRALKTHAENQIDDFLRQVGIKDPSECTSPQGWRELQYDSAEGFAFVQDEDGNVTFRVIAQIMPLPSDKELIVPLMRDLLEYNSLLLGASRFSIDGGSVYASAGQLVESIKDEAYADYINGVLIMAHTFTDDLMKWYGGTSRKRAARSVRR